MNVGRVPIGGVLLLEVEFVFHAVAGSLAAEENPLIVHGARDNAGGLFAGWLVFFKSIFEEFEEDVGVLVVEKESGCGGSVL